MTMILMPMMPIKEGMPWLRVTKQKPFFEPGKLSHGCSRDSIHSIGKKVNGYLEQKMVQTHKKCNFANNALLQNPLKLNVV